MDVTVAQGRLTAALATITHAWPLTYDEARTRVPAGAVIRRRAPGSKAPTGLHVLDARAAAVGSLASWAQLLIDDLGKRPDEPLDAGDGPALAAFLAVHVDVLAHHDAGPVAALELTEHARDLDRLANPDRPDALFIGRCPVWIREWDAACATPLYWSTQEQTATCTGCRTAGGWRDWLTRMGEDLDTTLTVTQLVTYLARRTGREFTHGQVRTWAWRKLIVPVGKNGSGRPVFDPTAVLVHAQRALLAD